MEYQCIDRELQALKCLFLAHMSRNAYLPPYLNIFHVIPYMDISNALPSWMDIYLVNMMMGSHLLTHISLQHASIIAHMQDPTLAFIAIWSYT